MRYQNGGIVPNKTGSIMSETIKLKDPPSITMSSDETNLSTFYIEKDPIKNRIEISSYFAAMKGLPELEEDPTELTGGGPMSNSIIYSFKPDSVDVAKKLTLKNNIYSKTDTLTFVSKYDKIIWLIYRQQMDIMMSGSRSFRPVNMKHILLAYFTNVNFEYKNNAIKIIGDNTDLFGQRIIPIKVRSVEHREDHRSVDVSLKIIASYIPGSSIASKLGIVNTSIKDELFTFNELAYMLNFYYINRIITYGFFISLLFTDKSSIDPETYSILIELMQLKHTSTSIVSSSQNTELYRFPIMQDLQFMEKVNLNTQQPEVRSDIFHTFIIAQGVTVTTSSIFKDIIKLMDAIHTVISNDKSQNLGEMMKTYKKTANTSLNFNYDELQNNLECVIGKNNVSAKISIEAPQIAEPGDIKNIQIKYFKLNNDETAQNNRIGVPSNKVVEIKCKNGLNASLYDPRIKMNITVNAQYYDDYGTMREMPVNIVNPVNTDNIIAALMSSSAYLPSDVKRKQLFKTHEYLISFLPDPEWIYEGTEVKHRLDVYFKMDKENLGIKPSNVDLYFVFRGSHTSTDWNREDIEISYKDAAKHNRNIYSFPLVFIKAIQLLFTRINEIINESKSINTSFDFNLNTYSTGHSLGGFMATMFSYYSLTFIQDKYTKTIINHAITLKLTRNYVHAIVFNPFYSSNINVAEFITLLPEGTAYIIEQDDASKILDNPKSNQPNFRIIKLKNTHGLMLKRVKAHGMFNFVGAMEYLFATNVSQHVNFPEFVYKSETECTSLFKYLTKNKEYIDANYFNYVNLDQMADNVTEDTLINVCDKLESAKEEDTAKEEEDPEFVDIPLDGGKKKHKPTKSKKKATLKKLKTRRMRKKRHTTKKSTRT
jgi:hypothetical protein